MLIVMARVIRVAFSIGASAYIESETKGPLFGMDRALLGVE